MSLSCPVSKISFAQLVFVTGCLPNLDDHPHSPYQLLVDTTSYQHNECPKYGICIKIKIMKRRQATADVCSE